MNDRETKTITTPIGQIEIVLKSYLTGLEKRNIVNASLPTSIDYDNEEGVKGMNPAQMMIAGENAALRNVIVSIGGNTPADIVDTVLSMHSADSDFIIAEVKKVVDGLSDQKKTI